MDAKTASHSSEQEGKDELKNGHFKHVEAIDGGDDVQGVTMIKSEAVNQESLEHDMSIREAVRMYPMACFWAFVMAFTIVSLVDSSCSLFGDFPSFFPPYLRGVVPIDKTWERKKKGLSP